MARQLHRARRRHHRHRRSAPAPPARLQPGPTDPLRLGLDTDARGAAGRPATDIFALGPPLRGRWYETTAIQEIRDQAAALARHLLNT